MLCEDFLRVRNLKTVNEINFLDEGGRELTENNVNTARNEKKTLLRFVQRERGKER